MSQPEVAVLVSTYQRPRHLERVLLSLRLQQEVSTRMEVVVTDDGSQDETLDLVQQFARSAPFPVRFTTHPHKTFQLARCRNEGVAASTAPYLIFLDGDCLVPPDHVQQHLLRRRPMTAMAGYCCLLDQSTTTRIDEQAITSGSYLQWADRRQLRKLNTLYWKSCFYSLIRHPLKPRLFGGNIGIWRKDYEHVNGYDERFEGWGCEDDDLRMRLRSAGVRIRSILRWTRTYHLWHPIDRTTPKRWREGSNVTYLTRRGRLSRCLAGLTTRTLDQLHVRTIGQPVTSEFLTYLLAKMWPGCPAGDGQSAPHRAEVRGAEVEVLVLPTRATFSRHAQCKVLVMLEDDAPSRKQLSAADVIISHRPLPHIDSQRVIVLSSELAQRQAA